MAHDFTSDQALDLDPRVLQATLGHNAVDRQLMMLVFETTLSTSLREMESALHNQDWMEAGDVAFQIKTSAQAIGAFRLADAMARAERAAHAHQTDVLLALHADLPVLVSALTASQRALLH